MQVIFKKKSFKDVSVFCCDSPGVMATMEGSGDVGCSLLCGFSSPLDVGDLQYGHQQLESILDVGSTVGRL